jgi:AcrR family transcriptional regulator
MNDELKQILIRVRELYMKYGIKSITMDDVASTLGISKKTLYQHVSDKDDLVGKVLDLEMETRQCDVGHIYDKGLNAIEELFEVSKYMNRMLNEQNPATMYDLKKYYPHHYQRLLKTKREKMYSNIVANLQKGKQEGLYRDDLNEEVIAKLYLSRLESIPDSELFTITELTTPKVFLEAITYHIRGIASEKGLALLKEKIDELSSINNI